MDVTDTYYAGAAIHGYGAQLLVDVGGASFIGVADVTSITPGEMTTAVIDKTHLRSPAAHREKLAGIRDSGPFTLEGNWRPTHGSHSNAGGDGFPDGGLLMLWRTRAETDFKIVVPLLTIEQIAALTPISLTGVVQAAGVATATAGAAHGLTSGMIVVIAGATPAAYNGSHVVTVTSATEFTFPIAAATTSPATGTITATPTGTLEWPFRGTVTRYQPGAITVDDKINFTADITPLQDSSADLP